MTRYVVVTGTSTGIGKTIATAALAAGYGARGSRVAVVKPVQTGVHEDEPGDVDEIARLSGVERVRELVRLSDPLAPDTAARLRDVSIPSVDELAKHAAEDSAQIVLVEGAGGVLVRLDRESGTIADLALRLRDHGHAVDVVVVTAAVLGTLNHTELTVEALRHRGLEPAGLVIGFWPAEPGLAERCNRDELPVLTGVPLLGVLPENAGSLSPADFRRAARDWLET